MKAHTDIFLTRKSDDEELTSKTWPFKKIMISERVTCESFNAQTDSMPQYEMNDRSSSEKECDESLLYGQRKTPTSRCSLQFGRFWAIGIPWSFCFILAALLYWSSSKSCPTATEPPQLLYSPAQDAVEYEVRRFRLGLDGDITEYQGHPSPELDKRWSELYEMGINLIPKALAAKLPNKTIIFPHDKERRYLVELDVFHQLHCLNMLRKALHPEYYKPHSHHGDQDELLGHDHIDHCIDAIRQSLMCSADISVLTWTWNEERKKNMEQGTVMHTCRNFDKIQDWAKKHAIYEEMDDFFRETNDPLDPSTWVDGYTGA